MVAATLAAAGGSIHRSAPISMSMASEIGGTQPLESRNDLVEVLSRGCKPEAAWRIGTEHEKFVFHTSDFTPVPYEGENGIGALIAGIQKDSTWLPVRDRGKIIGLKCPETGAAISLEPGGQFELSGAPLETIHQTCSETNEHLKMVRSVAEPLGIGFLGLGVAPTWAQKDMPRMPKSRYAIMEPYMEAKGSLGTSMMFRSCTVQANLDFSDENDMVKKMRVGLALQPVCTALFANSPFLDGKPNGYLSYRSHIWEDTDPDRTGMLPFAFEDGMGFERYVDYALDVPMYFVRRDGAYINVAGESFKDFLAGKLPQLRGEKPLTGDWEDHLSTIFPEVRLKQFLEVRGADGGPWQEICALPALWTGLYYDASALDAAWDLVKGWTKDQRAQLRHDVPTLALKAEIGGRAVREIAADVLGIARAGLTARARRNWEDADETVFLAPLEETVRTGKTRAERLLELYHGAWGGDLTPIFENAAY